MTFTPTERVQRSRERRKGGIYHFAAELHESAILALMDRGLLPASFLNDFHSAELQSKQEAYRALQTANNSAITGFLFGPSEKALVRRDQEPLQWRKRINVKELVLRKLREKGWNGKTQAEIFEAIAACGATFNQMRQAVYGLERDGLIILPIKHQSVDRSPLYLATKTKIVSVSRCEPSTFQPRIPWLVLVHRLMTERRWNKATRVQLNAELNTRVSSSNLRLVLHSLNNYPDLAYDGGGDCFLLRNDSILEDEANWQKPLESAS